MFRRLRFALALAGFILVAGIGVAVLEPHAGPSYLDPKDAGPSGSRALAQIMAQRGQQVVGVSSAQQAARESTANSTLVITDAAFLDGRELAALSAVPGDRVLVEPTAPELSVLAPAVSTAGAVPVGVAHPGCGLAAAQLAGNADMGGVTLHAPAPALPAAQKCYPVSALPSLIRYVTSGRTITVLGTGTPLTNASLADQGNAALDLNLLATHSTIVWLTPGTAVLTAAGTSNTTLTSLIPWAAYLIAIQLAVAVAATAAWRARRLGPLVTEPLPVVVRAAETVEGHGRLYRSRRSRDRAAEALRGAVIDRLMPRLGLAPGAEPATITAAVAARSRRDVAAVNAELFGPAPDTDAALVKLANDLDTLESEVRKT